MIIGTSSLPYQTVDSAACLPAWPGVSGIKTRRGNSTPTVSIEFILFAAVASNPWQFLPPLIQLS